MNLIKFYKKALEIRFFEKKLLELFDKGVLNGTTHTCIGQENICVSSLSNIKSESSDVVISNHRCHGHFLAYGGSEKALMLELMGKKGGLTNGIGGSQHIYYKNFYSNGILGGMVPVSLGIALHLKNFGKNNLVLTFLGDGAFGEGVVYESFNIASKFDLPILFVIENNRYAQSTKIEDNLAGSIINRLKAFNINSIELSDQNLTVLDKKIKLAFRYVRKKQKPYCVIINTYRFSPHSKGDDNRPEKEIKKRIKKDPLKLLENKLNKQKIKIIQKEVIDRINDITHQCLKEKQIEKFRAIKKIDINEKKNLLNTGKESFFLDKLNNIIDEILKKNKKAYVIGEDLLDPYGGAFKVTKNLSTKYKKQIFSMPFSEAAITGIANGLYLKGQIAIVEIMFGDFLTLTADQIINHLSKFSAIYSKKFNGKVILRTPMGGYRGYGPTHSQSLEKIYFGIPYIDVYSADLIHDQKKIWDMMISGQNNCIYIENKSIYSKRVFIKNNNLVNNFKVMCNEKNSFFTLLSLQEINRNSDCLICCYGSMVNFSMELAKKLFVEKEINLSIAVFNKISPLEKKDIKTILSYSKKIITIEESSKNFSWGSELGSMLLELNSYLEKVKFLKLGAKSTVIPSAKQLELKILPGIDDCVRKISEFYET
jgi:2-oxoisovalerate dehydrogenase E1 component